MKNIAPLLGRVIKHAKQQTLAAYEYKDVLSQRDRQNIILALTLTLLNKKKRQEANKYIVKALQENADENKYPHLRRHISRKEDQWQKDYTTYLQALKDNNQPAAWFFAYGRTFMKKKQWNNAETAFRRAIELQSKNADYYFHLSQSLDRQNKWWQEIAELETAIALKLNPPKTWFSKLAHAQKKMDLFAPAAENYRKAIGFFEWKARLYYNLGFCLEKSGDTALAETAYGCAQRRDRQHGSKTLGIGILHEHDQFYPEAIAAYNKTIAENGASGEIYYHLGLIHSLLFQWAEAEAFLKKAVEHDDQDGNWFYRLGCAAEYLNKWAEAASAYRTSLQKPSDKQDNQTAYRLGFVLDQQGLYTEACEAFLGVMPPSGETVKSIEELKRAIARENDFSPLLHYKLGQALMWAGRMEEASASFKNMSTIEGPYSSLYATYKNNKPLIKNSNYTEYFKNLPLEDNMIMYESFHGGSMSCNPYGLFMHILDRTEFAGWTHIWVVNDNSKIPDAFKQMDNVVFVKRESDLYFRYVSRAKYLINNNTFPHNVQRKDGQIYLNTWHGTPLKTLGKDIRGSFMEYKNAARNFLQSTHLLSPNPHTSHIIEDRHDLTGIYTGKIIEAGYPRIDMTLNLTADRKAALKTQLGIPDGRKVVLYAPTWRGSLGAVKTDGSQFIKDIEALQQMDCHLLFRGHAIDEKLVSGLKISSCVVPGTIDTNKLLGIVDVLVTDYSSIAFDFMATKRPIVYYTHDKEEYEAERGMYLSMDDMPGENCPTLPELISAIEKQLKGAPQHPNYAKAFQDFCLHENGQTSKTIVDMVFFGKEDSTVIANKPDNRQSILFFGGPFNMNGITTSYLNLLGSLDQSRFISTIGIDAATVSNTPENLANFNRLPEQVKVIPRVGGMNVTLEEKRVVDYFNKHYKLESPEMWRIYNQVFQREFLRMFGDAHFDKIVNFEGYSIKWAATLANAPNKQARRVIYQHNDMYGEMTCKYPYLRGNFNLYPSYDAIIAVSAQARDANRDNLAHRFNINPALFDNVDNLQNEDRTLTLAKLPVEECDRHIFDGAGPVFMTIGRLSSEKDHAKLLRSFQKIVQETPGARLIIVGDGPLRQELAALIRILKLENAAFLLGIRPNPFALLQRADCFVLSSHYEGQPMVLFEAMMLDKPIVSTDVVGSHDLITGRSGLLVEDNEAALAEGLRAFIRGEVKVVPFDCGAFNRDAVEQFSKKALGL